MTRQGVTTSMYTVIGKQRHRQVGRLAPLPATRPSPLHAYNTAFLDGYRQAAAQANGTLGSSAPNASRIGKRYVWECMYVFACIYVCIHIRWLFQSELHGCTENSTRNSGRFCEAEFWTSFDGRSCHEGNTFYRPIVHLPFLECIYLSIYLSIYRSIDRSIDRSIHIAWGSSAAPSRSPTPPDD